MESLIPTRLTALGHPQRLAVFRLLIRRYPDEVPATELAQALEIKPNTLSTYVNTLRHAGLITQTRVGTSVRYAIAMQAVEQTLNYLMLDCCRGRPELCLPAKPMLTSEPKRVYNVLFICTGNSARSIFAEAILRDLSKGRFEAFSAGTKPRSELNPFALQILKQKQHDTTSLKAKNIDAVRGADAPDFDFVFTVCDQAANEECPAWQGQPISAHWGLKDPVKVAGTDAEKSLAFQQTYGALHHRISAFTALPLAELDRISLQNALDNIGQSEDTS